MTDWELLPPLDYAAPVMAAAADRRNVWVGGAGGIARYNGQAWDRPAGPMPLSSVSALCAAGGRLLAGGPEGVALSGDGGKTWKLTTLEISAPISALAAAPHAGRSDEILAATLGKGILRSTTGGDTWRMVNEGLEDMDVLCLAWRANDRVLAGTTGGIYLSSDGGFSWELCNGSAGKVIAGVVYIPGHTAGLAALENGGLLVSTGSGRTWQALKTNGLPAEMEINALAAAPDGSLLLGSSGAGTFRSTNGGVTWTQVSPDGALIISSGDHGVYAGLIDGAAVYREERLERMPDPPMHDLRSLLYRSGCLYLVGLQSGLWQWFETGWRRIPVPTDTITAVSATPTGAIVLAGTNGLFRSEDGGESWRSVHGAAQIDRLTFKRGRGPIGAGAGGSIDGKHLLITGNDGQTWQAATPAFDGQMLVTLGFAPGGLAAATYTPSETRARLWSSQDGGLTWRRGIEAETNWSVVHIWEQPPLVTLGGTMLIQREDGSWRRTEIGPEGNAIFLIAAEKQHIYALTAAGLMHSPDLGETWETIPDAPAAEQVHDMLMVDGTLTLLRSNGQVMRRHAPAD